MNSDRLRSRLVLGVASCALFVGAAGCSGTSRRLAISVRDGQTHEPIAGAKVRATPLHFFLPLYPHPILDLGPDDATTAISDDDGRAVVSIPARKPVRLHVHAPGYAPLALDMPHELSNERWLRDDDFDVDAGSRRHMEVRITPAGAKQSPAADAKTTEATP